MRAPICFVGAGAAGGSAPDGEDDTMIGRTCLVAAAAVSLLAAAGCGSSTSSDPATRPGSPIVYARIERDTDCVALQREFDTAMDNADARPSGDDLRNASLSYAEAADNRMREIGCYR